MEKLTDQDGKSLDIVNENLEALKTIFPESFTEDGVSFEVLRELLGDAVAEGEEKYGLTWHGKKKARQIALTPSLGTLRPCKEESVDWDTTQNLFIEGDNLEVLKLLQKSYANKVKMIYIDPPYNTGKEFIYPDKFQDNLDTYLRYTGQKDNEGFKISSNSESSGRFHTNWLNMMYPRLKLARGLLHEKGLIFISIDQNESSNLRKVCDEIFGEDNFVSSIVWEKRYTRSNNAKLFATLTETVLLYRKSEVLETIKEPRSEKADSIYDNPDDDPRGVWTSVSYVNPATIDQRPNLVYDIENPITGQMISHPTNAWKYEPATYEKHAGDNRLFWGKDGGNKYPRLKKFLSELDGGMVPVDLWKRKDTGTTDEGSKELEALFGRKIFDFPKPVSLIKRAISIATDAKDGWVLDFFAGSAPTAQAVMQQNSDDKGIRRFILVQLPEPCEEKSEAFKAGYKTIAEISKERIRRAAAKIKEENQDYEGDLGFKVFKLDSSNIRAWNPDRNDLEQSIIDHTEHLIEGRSQEDVLYELLLKRGVDLTVPIEAREITTKGTKNTKKEKESVRGFRDFRGSKKVFSIGDGVLFACLDTAINREEVEDLAMGIIDWRKELEPASDTQVVFRDSAFENDIAKTNMTAILEQNGIKHVRSL
ncbi:MAG: site-specific DNA-methyltransferase [Thermodesulfobacteriota bacterium]|nr:site-specific DNA-methyltransferase [Thermodesulfobacteriota bacterium]